MIVLSALMLTQEVSQVCSGDETAVCREPVGGKEIAQSQAAAHYSAGDQECAPAQHSPGLFFFISLFIDCFHAETDPALPIDLKHLDLDEITFR